ncbi:MAG TPA: ABC transporter permease, partial [Gemmatimonadaceae bacterium]|nr:ABC transporter permease [Gemmatimonadaceae bacterium]
MRPGRHLLALLVPLGVVAVSVLLLAGLVAASGLSPSAALGALVRGAVGSPYALLSGTLLRATPLLLAGLAVALAFRAGVLNIGAEGQLLAGAAAAAAVGLGAAGMSAAIAAPLALLAGTVAGAAWASIAALLRTRFGVLEVISTIMLNFVAIHAVGYLVRGPLQEPTRAYPQTNAIAEVARLAPLAPGQRLHWGFLLALGAAVLLWLGLRYTAAGFRLRVVGANPAAAASAGLVSVARTTAGAFVLSGALAGLAGAVELQGVTYALYENLSPGYGYTAIAVALLARLEPLLVVPSAILFGALEAGGAAMQRDAGVPSVLVAVIEATLILAVLAFDRLRVTPLAAFGARANAV